MTNIAYVIVLVLLISWALGFFVYGFGEFVHLLLIIAIIVIIFKIIRGKKILN